MAGRLDRKVALITGAGRGMGRAGALLFACEGATVVVADRRRDAAQEVAERVAADGGQALAVEVDVTDDASIRAMTEATTAAFGRIDVLWNNVGGLGWQADGTRRSIALGANDGDILSIDPTAWEWSIRFNLTSVYLCCRHVLPVMIAGGGGSIINTSSGAALARSSNFHPYAVGKAGVITLSKLIARRYAAQGIRCNALVPGLIDSWGSAQVADRAKETVPLGREGTTDEVARTALFLASDESSFVTGEALHVAGGAQI
ncbi:MAG: SDR family NAD(P)-dependent oxidoreductase [Dehalococcoidia bacterium]